MNLLDGLTPRRYVRYANDNYGAHAIEIRFSRLRIFYSYQTPIAFFHPEFGLVARKNDWGPTTARHLRAAVGDTVRESRLDGSLFEQKLAEAEMVEQHYILGVLQKEFRVKQRKAARKPHEGRLLRLGRAKKENGDEKARVPSHPVGKSRRSVG